MEFFTKVKAIVTPEYDNRIIGRRRSIERGHQAADLLITICDCGKISTHGMLPLTGLCYGFMVWRVEGPIPRDIRHIVQIGFQHVRKDNAIQREHIEEPFGCVPGQMGFVEAGGE